MSHKSAELESPRNSKIREISKKPLTKIVELLDNAFPWLTPNEVTVLGTAGLGVLIIYTSKLEKEGKIDLQTSLKLLAAFAALSGTDAIDGSLARYKAEQGDTSHDSSIGQLVDSLSDRLQEAFLSWLAMYRAAEQGDKLWLITATLTAITNPLSSLVRAWAESKGIAVPESGKNLFELLGTRLGRAATSTTRLLPPIEIGDTSAQAIIDGLTAAATTKITLSRLQAVQEGKLSDEPLALDEKTINDAKRRFNLLSGLAVITGLTTSFLLYKLLNKQDK
ncbi:MAG: CDP-alcohol phosphatidyltransferase family protein [Candidatus Pacebacteria bacterium]|nr:CDP-alcohol phosphatidyltransferase family protein [Candidatus Paceibacterota bacterium]